MEAPATRAVSERRLEGFVSRSTPSLALSSYKCKAMRSYSNMEAIQPPGFYCFDAYLLQLGGEM